MLQWQHKRNHNRHSTMEFCENLARFFFQLLTWTRQHGLKRTKKFANC